MPVSDAPVGGLNHSKWICKWLFIGSDDYYPSQGIFFLSDRKDPASSIDQWADLADHCCAQRSLPQEDWSTHRKALCVMPGRGGQHTEDEWK